MENRSKSQRKTTQRRIILQTLRSTKSHPTADWIYTEVRKIIPNISLGTVYRNLRLLNESGKILKLDYGSGFSRFDGNAENHYHIRCLKCGRVDDVDQPLERGLEQQVAQKTGYDVVSHRLEFCGVCPDCLSSEK